MSRSSGPDEPRVGGGIAVSVDESSGHAEHATAIRCGGSRLELKRLAGGELGLDMYDMRKRLADLGLKYV